MRVAVLTPILDRFGLRKTPRTKADVIERIIQELIVDHAPCRIRSQRHWRSPEQLYWPLGQAPREDILETDLEPDRTDLESVMPSDSVGCQRSPNRFVHRFLHRHG